MKAKPEAALDNRWPLRWIQMKRREDSSSLEEHTSTEPQLSLSPPRNVFGSLVARMVAET